MYTRSSYAIVAAIAAAVIATTVHAQTVSSIIDNRPAARRIPAENQAAISDGAKTRADDQSNQPEPSRWQSLDEPVLHYVDPEDANVVRTSANLQEPVPMAPPFGPVVESATGPADGTLVPWISEVRATSSASQSPPNGTPVTDRCACANCRTGWCETGNNANNAAERAARRLAKKCQHQNSHWGFPEEFCERPFGSSAGYYLGTQISNGLAAQMKLYHYDFFAADSMASSKLTARGRYQVQKIARLLEQHPGPIVVQRTLGQPELDESRRQAVLNAVTELGYPIVPEQVVADYNIKPGISAVEELLMQQTLIEQTTVRGISTTTTTSQIR